MKVVTTWEQIENNIKTLDQYRHSADEAERRFYLDLVKNGICFVVCTLNGEKVFAPSRFIGYIGNQQEAHLANDDKHGGKTNPAISKILKMEPTPQAEVEEAYKDFRERLGLKPGKAGRFGHQRKY